MMVGESLVHTAELCVGYRTEALLPPINLEIAKGQRWAVLGPNGGGKTTYLRTLLGLMPAVSGSVSWSTECRRSYVAQSAQDIRSFPITVTGYVSGGIDRKNSFLNPFIPLSAQAKERVQLALKQTQMYPLAGTRISELSEGQYQRVRIARALASDPDILVLDEPTTGLDIHRQRELFELLRQLSGLGIASITVSHRLGSVQESASHILFVDKHCQVAVSGPASEIMEHPSYLGHYGASSPAIEAAP